MRGRGRVSVLHSASPVFDLTVTELLVPLVGGGAGGGRPGGGAGGAGAGLAGGAGWLVKVTPAHLAALAAVLGGCAGRGAVLVVGGEQLAAGRRWRGGWRRGAGAAGGQ